jgi:endonuclease/exonuclease/phosphatase family metal-dependent hydrolase
MTWNIHGAYGRNKRFDLQRAIALIQRHRPDIVALQEIDSRRPRETGIAEPFGMLQSALGSHAIEAKSITTQDGEYGQALISRWPIRSAEIHDISYQEREPRRAMCGVVMTPHGDLRVLATHLGLSIRERRGQSQALLRLIGAGALPTVVMGDFNDWFWAGSVRKVLSSRMASRTRLATFPSVWPIFRFDRIYCSAEVSLRNARTDRDARIASDHLPVIADVTVTDISSGSPTAGKHHEADRGAG